MVGQEIRLDSKKPFNIQDKTRQDKTRQHKMRDSTIAYCIGLQKNDSTEY